MSKNDKKIATLYSCFKNGEQRVRRAVVISAKWFKCDSYVSDYVFAHCRDMVDLMRRGLWAG